MKEYNEQVLKFKITEDELQMTIKLEDLAWLFANSPNNFDGEEIMATVKDKQLFAEKIVEYLMDDAGSDSNDVNWGVPFEDAFTDIYESGDYNVLEYTDEDTVGICSLCGSDMYGIKINVLRCENCGHIERW
jgi:hypothetical protein